MCKVLCLPQTEEVSNAAAVANVNTLKTQNKCMFQQQLKFAGVTQLGLN